MSTQLACTTATTAPVVSQETSLAMFQNAFAGFSTGARFLRARKLDFQITSGGETTIIPNGKLVAVLLGVAPFNHCTWYERDYAPGQEPAAPDLCWVQKTANDFPAALPEMYRHKVNINGQERWKFRIARRTVWALVVEDGQGGVLLDIDNPVIFDITSASMYGKSDPRTHSYKWAGLRGFCAQFSTPVVTINPSMFYMQIALDPDATQGVVVFRPAVTQQGTPQYLSQESWQAVVNAAQSTQVTDMLRVTETLEWPKGGAKPAAAQATVQTVSYPPSQEAAPVMPSENMQFNAQSAQPAPAAQPAQPAQTVVPADVVAPATNATTTVTPDLLNAAQSVLQQAQATAQPAATSQPAPAAQPEPAPAAQPEAKSQPTFPQPQVSDAAKRGIANLLGDLTGL